MYLVVKRCIDIIAAGLGLIVLSPLLVVTAFAVSIRMGSPVVFKQMRPGLHGRSFNMYKFRTMTNEKDEKGNLLPDSQRLTRLGKILRSSSLDELPELFNVL